MSFSEIRLPNLVLVELYKSALVDIPEKIREASNNDIPQQPTLVQPLNFLGENLKNILVLVNYEQEQFLPDDQLDFLSTILKACQLNIADIAIVNTANLQGNLDHHITELRPKNMLLFGAQIMISLGNTSVAEFNITEYSGVPMVSSPPLEDLNQNHTESKFLKRKLWDCLKQLFNI